MRGRSMAVCCRGRTHCQLGVARGRAAGRMARTRRDARPAHAQKAGSRAPELQLTGPPAGQLEHRPPSGAAAWPAAALQCEPSPPPGCLPGGWPRKSGSRGGQRRPAAHRIPVTASTRCRQLRRPTSKALPVCVQQGGARVLHQVGELLARSRPPGSGTAPPQELQTSLGS